MLNQLSVLPDSTSAPRGRKARQPENADPIDKLNLLGYNIPAVYTTGISGGVPMERTETQMKILEVGKKEFLEKGFKDASLNKIVAEAGFTKGAFYGYYPDKAALFEDLVDEAAKGLLEQFKAAQSAHFDLVSEEKTKDSLKLSTEYLRVFVEYMYTHFDAFKLILCRAEGTRYANFLEELVELEVECSEEYYALLRKRGKLSGKMTKQLHHMITSAYFTAVCETIAHDMPKEEAMRYIEELAKFFNSGWKGLLRLE